MGGLILDNIVVFLYRLIAILVGEYRSRDWPRAKGILTDARTDGSYGYPLAEVTYSYTVDGTSYSGLYKKGFWYRDSAVRFAQGLASQTELVVRYRLGSPVDSFLRKSDQRSSSA
ncbi:MAG: hypothetical protein ACRYFU_02740 [Janthinobacterium lividum]